MMPNGSLSTGQDDRVGSVQPAEQLLVVEVAQERHRTRDPMRAGLLLQPLELRAFTGDGERRAGVAAPNPRQRGDRVLYALLVPSRPTYSRVAGPDRGASGAGSSRW